MNSLSAFIIIGLILIYFPLAVVPTANVASNISDTSCTSGLGCFFFGNLGFFMVFLLILTLFYWMFIG